MEGKGGGGPDLSTIYVGDLAPEVTETHLYELFATIGPVAGTHVCRDSITRRSLGYAYVNYYSQLDAQQALERLNFTEIKGRSCRVMWSKRDKPFKASPDANIFIKNLDPSIDSRSLNDTFCIFGAIVSCKVSTSATGASRGYGFVQYESEDAAKQAIERVNGMEIAGRQVYVGPFKKRDESSQDCSLYVRNIPETWADADVLKLFEPFGEMASHLLMSDTRMMKRHGFVNFKDPEAANAAVEALNGKDTRTEEEIAEAEKEKAEKEKETAAADAETKDGDTEEKKEGEKNEAKGKERQPFYRLIVSKSKSKAEREEQQKSLREKKEDRFDGIKLHIRNLPTDMKESTLRELFEPFGTVTDVKVVQDRDTGLGKGYGFIRFATMEEAKTAVEKMHMKDGLQVGLAGQRGEGEGKGERKGKGKGEGKGKGKGKGKDGGKDGFSQPAMPMGMYPQQQPFPNMYGQYPMQYPGAPGAAMMPGAAARPPWPYQYPMMGTAPPMMGMPPGIRPGMPGMQAMPLIPRATLPAQPMPAGYPGMMPPAGVPQAPPAQRPPVPQPAGQAGQLDAATLAQMDPVKRKQVLGENLFPQVSRLQPDLAGKVTGMLLEVNDTQLLAMLQDPATLQRKVSEAVAILKQQKA